VITWAVTDNLRIYRDGPSQKITINIHISSPFHRVKMSAASPPMIHNAQIIVKTSRISGGGSDGIA
jgi:hypothetical protein